MTQFDELLARLERCEMEAQAARGYIKALEYGMHVLIARHPSPAELDELWAHLLPEVAEHHAGMQDRPPLYHAALQQALGVITQQISAAANRD